MFFSQSHFTARRQGGLSSLVHGALRVRIEAGGDGPQRGIRGRRPRKTGPNERHVEPLLQKPGIAARKIIERDIELLSKADDELALSDPSHIARGRARYFMHGIEPDVAQKFVENPDQARRLPAKRQRHIIRRRARLRLSKQACCLFPLLSGKRQ